MDPDHPIVQREPRIKILLKRDSDGIEEGNWGDSDRKYRQKCG